WSLVNPISGGTVEPQSSSRQPDHRHQRPDRPAETTSTPLPGCTYNPSFGDAASSETVNPQPPHLLRGVTSSFGLSRPAPLANSATPEDNDQSSDSPGSPVTAEIWTVVAICLLQFATYPPLAMHRLFCPRSAACLAGGLLLVAVAGRAQEIDPTAASAPPATESPSVQLLQDAREKLSSYRTLKAKIVETVEFGPRRFRAEGEYLQGLGNR